MQDQTIRYVNNSNESYILQGDGRGFVDISQLYGYDWQYDTVASVTGAGGVVSSFRHEPRRLGLEVRLRGFSRSDFLAKMNELHAIAEADVIANTPGRLYVGDQYTECFLATSGAISGMAKVGNFTTEEIGVLITRPYWCMEKTYQYNPVEAETVDAYGKKYNGRYPYRYGTGLAVSRINNTHYTECPAVITIYGATSNPTVTIAGNIYNVEVTLLSTERLVIDQIKKEIHRVASNGTKTSVFNNRNKNYDIFKPVPAGDQVLMYSGDFLMTITLVEQRSQLKWVV